MKTKLGLFILLLIFTLVFTKYAIDAADRKYFSEHPTQPSLSSPAASTKHLEPIVSTNLSDMQELSQLPQNNSGAVIAYSEGSENDVLQAVYESGTFIRWDIRTSQVLGDQPLFLGSTDKRHNSNEWNIYQTTASVSFSKDGSYLIVPAQTNTADYSLEISRKYAIWNLNSMEQEYRLSDLAQNHVLHPTSDIVFSATKSRVSITFGFGGDHGGGAPLVYRDQEGLSFTRLAVDPSGDYLAISDDAGNVLLGDISRLNSYQPDDMFNLFFPKATYRTMGFPRKNVTTTDLKFDETHSWLAWLTDKNLVVWSLRNYIFPLHMKIDLEGGHVMSFDRAGKILVVGTTDGMQIFDLAQKKQIAEYKVGEVTALYFTRDNRLLIWGDAQGTIHLWGVK